MAIVRKKVYSSSVESMGHDGSKNILEVEFKSKTGQNTIYHYYDVTRDDYLDLLDSGSIGRDVRRFPNYKKIN